MPRVACCVDSADATIHFFSAEVPGNAARIGTPLQGCRMYLPWFPCMDCARAVVQSGIVELICVKPDLSDPQWGSDFADVPQLLEEASVRIRWWEQAAEEG